MKIFRVYVALAVLILLVSSCAANSVSTIANSQSSTTIINSPVPTGTATSAGAVASSTPSIRATISQNPTVEPTETPAVGDSIKFNEDNFTQYFHFGMSSDAVDAKLKDLGIDLDEVEFSFDSNNLLYSISVTDWETAKGLKIGDSLDKLHSLYGKEDEKACELNSSQYEYLYNKDGYVFSIFTGDSNADIFSGCWSVFVDIWNYPNIFTSSTSSTKPGNGPAKKLVGDDSIKFNEVDFTKYFHIGMSKQAVEKKLTDLGVRIIGETAELDYDFKYRSVLTDHVDFDFEADTNKLFSISVMGWETAKGLKYGDSLRKLHQLYGKENSYNDNGNAYIYKRNGFKFFVYFSSDDIPAFSFWSVYRD